jgi:hypothetical protein
MMFNLKRACPGRAGQNSTTQAGRLRWRAAAVAAVSAVTAAAVAAAVSVPGPRPAAPVKATLMSCPSLPGTVTCGQWSGYVVEGMPDPAEMDAIVDVPQITCRPGQTTGGNAFWIGVQGPASDGTEALVQPGVDMNCDSGQPFYGVATTNVEGFELPPLAEPVSAGDAIYLQITNDGSGNYVQQIVDFTASGGFWSQTVNVSGGPVGTADIVAFAAESYDGGVDFQQADVNGAAINGQPLAEYNPNLTVEDPANYTGWSALVPSILDSTGQDLQFSWDPWPPWQE